MGLYIYLLRHGETTASQTGGYCGSIDPELTPTGYLMAEDFVKSYAALRTPTILNTSKRLSVLTLSTRCLLKPSTRTATMVIQKSPLEHDIELSGWFWNDCRNSALTSIQLPSSLRMEELRNSASLDNDTAALDLINKKIIPIVSRSKK
jgi:hypothetical protein